MNSAPPFAFEAGLNHEISTPFIRLQDLSVRYGQREALSRIHLTLRRGERLGVIGPNGAGKTTLLRVILGLTPPTEGTLTQITPAPRVGYVPQRLGVDSHFPITAREFLRIHHPGSFFGFGASANRMRAAIASALRQVGAESLRDRRIGELSGGETQRILVAAAILRKPELLVLDEPSAGIDHHGREDLLTLLRSLHQQSNFTLVFVSHDLHLVSGLADRVACLNNSLCALGAPEDILREHVLGEVYGRSLPQAPNFNSLILGGSTFG